MAHYKDLKPGSRYKKTPRIGRYRVQRGDSLWEIARLAYGHGEWWEQIAEWNKINRKRPLLIGLSIHIPAPRQAHHFAPDGHVLAPHEINEHGVYDPYGAFVRQNNPSLYDNHRLAREFQDGPFKEARPVLFPAFKYELEGLTFEQITPLAEYKVSFKGEITLQQQGVITGGLTFVKEGIEAEYKTDADGVFKDLFTKSNAKYSPGKLELSLAVGATIKSGNKTIASTEFAIITPTSFRLTTKGNEIKGSYKGLDFTGVIGYEAIVTLKPRIRIDDHAEVVTTWLKIEGIALVIVAAVIVVADAGKDVGTLGMGSIESPLSWTAAAALFSRGLAMVRSTP